jgi:hypothetical protein
VKPAPRLCVSSYSTTKVKLKGRRPVDFAFLAFFHYKRRQMSVITWQDRPALVLIKEEINKPMT